MHRPNLVLSLSSTLRQETLQFRGDRAHGQWPDLTNGTVVVSKGKVIGVDPSATLPSELPIVRADGLHIYPGMIDAGTVIGLAELDSAKETLDFNEGGDFQPDLRAGVAVNPDSELIPVTRATAC